MSETDNLKRKIRRQKQQIERLKAECELYQMMAFDLASQPLIASIHKQFPIIAKKWERAA